MTIKDKAKIVGTLVVFVLYLVLFIGEIPYTFNTFNFPIVLGISLGVGVIAGFGAALYFKQYTEELIEKFQLFVSLLIVGLMVIPVLISYTNRIWVTETTEEVIFLENEEVYGIVFKSEVSDSGTPDPTGYNLHVERKNGEVEVLRYSYNIAESWTEGEIVELPVYRGLYGIYFVYPK